MRVFSETQKFNQSWLRVVLIVVAALTMLPVLIMSDWDSMDTTEAVIIIGAIALILFIIFFVLFIFRLDSRIDDHGVHYGFYPIPGKMNKCSWADIEQVYVRKYSPISEYGGWGYRISFNRSSGRAYNVQGDIGIQLELKNGKKVLIGTQKKDEAERTIRYYTNKEQDGAD